MRKIIFITTLFIISLSFIASKKSDRHGGTVQLPNPTPPIAYITDQKLFNINNISTWYRNNGSYNRNPVSGNSGFEWPKGTNKFARYASGLWAGGLVNGQIRVVVAEYDYEYLSGEIINGVPTGKDDPNYRLYIIRSPNDPDYAVWPVNQGAPTDLNGNPLILGGMTMYYVYTDGYPESHGNRAGSTQPLMIDVQQTNFGFTLAGPLSDMIFQRFRVINKGNHTIDSMYISLWTDDDIGTNFRRDQVGCDTMRSLGFTYKADPSDPSYPISPAVGFDFFQGPLVDSPGDTARIPDLRSQTIIVIPNKKVLGLASFNKYTNGDPNFGDPANYIETYNYMKGKTKTGADYINPVTNAPTTYVHSGDPESGTGWLDSNPDDRRFMMSTGPFKMMPGDTQDIVTVQLIAVGLNNFNSVTKLKNNSDVAQRIYDNAFQAPSAFPAPNVFTYAPGNGKIYISWDGYPETITVPNSLSQHRYKFEAYQVVMIKPGTVGDKEDDLVPLATYDIKNHITDLKDSVLDNYGIIVWTTIYRFENSGIKRFLVLDKDPLTQAPFINGTEYRFAVLSIGYDSVANIANGSQKINRSNVLNSIVRVRPQQLVAGTQVNYKIGDTVATNRRDLAVMPIVVNPLELKSGTYRSTFSSANGLSWTLTKDGNTLVSNYTDFSGTQDTALVFDGLMMVHQVVSDSGVVKDPDDPLSASANLKTRQRGWTYNPPANQWIRGVSTTAITTAKLFTGRQFDSRSMGISFPHASNFRTVATRVKANGTQFTPLSGSLSGGPLRIVKIVFGQTQKAYRYSSNRGNELQLDTTLNNMPYRDYVDIPFSVFAADPLDSSAGATRQLNVAFVDTDDNGVWDPDTTALGKYQLVYILASTYDPNPQTFYTTRNVGFSSPVSGFASMDIMYVWAPRVRNVNGAPMTYQTGDVLTIYPYIITRPEFVPGYPIYYEFNVDGTIIGSNTIAQQRNDLDRVNVFPNPYYGGHRLETSDFDRFVYFSNLPMMCNIYIYTLNGELVKVINRNSTDPQNSLEKWDLTNLDNIYVASGMYIAYIDAPGIGNKVLKIAIMTPEERIRRF